MVRPDGSAIAVSTTADGGCATGPSAGWAADAARTSSSEPTAQAPVAGGIWSAPRGTARRRSCRMASREVDGDVLGSGRGQHVGRSSHALPITTTSACVSSASTLVAHQGRDVRDLLLDVAAVRADQASEPRRCPSRIRTSSPLPIERLDEGDQRALPQVVGARLEGQADDADASLPSSAAPRSRLAAPVPRSRARSIESTGTVTSVTASGIEEGPQVLRQARAAEGEARSQIGVRHVELAVHRERSRITS